MLNNKMLLASSILLVLSSTVQAMPNHLPSIYGNTNPSGPPNSYSRGWNLTVYEDNSNRHNKIATVPLCFAYSGINNTHEHGVVYSSSNWAGRWNQEGDQVRFQMQNTGWPFGEVVAQSSAQLELVTQVGTPRDGLRQVAYGHFDHWGNTPVMLGTPRLVFNAALEEMSLSESKAFCRLDFEKISTEQDYLEVIKKLPPLDLKIQQQPPAFVE